jgi:PKD repeat protein
VLNYSFPNAGNHTVFVRVVDFNGNLTTAMVGIFVGVAAPLPLRVTAQTVAPSSPGARIIGFVTQVSGGRAPYTIQWTFGDGTSGTSLPGETVYHEYAAAGTYVPELSVVDAAGQTYTRSFDPIVVAGSSPGLTGGWFGSGAAAAGATYIALAILAASAAVVVTLVRWATLRREGLNWLRGMEPDEVPVDPPSTGR